jgi:predicted nucleic acid-binding protein
MGTPGMIDEILSRHQGGRVYFDTNCFIYVVEGIERYRPVLEPLMNAVAAGGITGVTGEITLAEVLVKPLRDQLAQQVLLYKQMLADRQPFMLVPITQVIWESAASLRARLSVRLPDAVHLAAARQSGCRLFVTNDAALRSPPELEILHIETALTRGA